MAEGVMTFLLVIYCLINILLRGTSAERKWSGWYNGDTPTDDGIDNETVDMIALKHHMDCDLPQIEAVECRRVGSNVTFSNQYVFKNNILFFPCNTSGVACRDLDNVPSHDGTLPCSDYEIRFSCPAQENLTTTPSGNIADIGSHGGFIAMAAGSSLILPLISVFVIQLRKAKREERRRQRLAQRASDDAAHAEAAARAVDAPPAYEMLFGTALTVSVIPGHLRSGSQPERSRIAELVLEREDGSRVVFATETVPSPTARSVTSPTAGEGPGGPPASLAIRMSDIVASTAASEARLTNIVPSAEEVSVSGHNLVTTSCTICNSDNSACSAGRRGSTDGDSDAASVSSTDALLLSHHGDHVTHGEPPPGYESLGRRNRYVSVHTSDDCHASENATSGGRGEGTSGPGLVGEPQTTTPCSDSLTATSTPTSSSSISHANVATSTQSLYLNINATIGTQTNHHANQTTGTQTVTCPTSNSNSTPPETPTRSRFLGMHLSIHELMEVIYTSPEPEIAPPPSYDDALKILSATKQSEHQVL